MQTERSFANSTVSKGPPVMTQAQIEQVLNTQIFGELTVHPMMKDDVSAMKKQPNITYVFNDHSQQEETIIEDQSFYKSLPLELQDYNLDPDQAQWYKDVQKWTHDNYQPYVKIKCA